MTLRQIRQTAKGPLAEKASALLDKLRSLGSVLVAFSGGVDSSFLLAAAHEACGPQVLAVTASSPIHPRREIEDALRLASLIGCEHEIIKTKEMEDPCFYKNPHDRCYGCKRGLFMELSKTAASKGLSAVVEGSTVDDLSDFRPGERALLELRVESPLRHADFTKADVRDLSRAIGLPNWDKPSSACLASRFPYGTEITREALAKVERLEGVLMELGFGQVRARYHGDIVRIEVEPGSIELASRPDKRDALVQAARREGFRFVTLDLQGYRMGSLNPP
jgi:uncharacterized protein